jgi:hypothetical protein
LSHGTAYVTFIIKKYLSFSFITFNWRALMPDT